MYNDFGQIKYSVWLCACACMYHYQYIVPAWVTLILYLVVLYYLVYTYRVFHCKIFIVNLRQIIIMSYIFQDVYFPTVIVCNINQNRRSLFRGLGITNESRVDLLYKQFYSGMDRNLTKEEQEFIFNTATSEVIYILQLVAFTNYVDKILAFFDLLTPWHW